MSGGKTTKTTSSQQQTATTALPAWMTSAGQDLFGKASDAVAANPAGAYTGPMTAGPSANQQAASRIAAANAGSWAGDLSTARGLTMGAAAAPAASVGAQGTRAVMTQGAQQGVSGMTAAQRGYSTGQSAQQGYASAGSAPVATAAQTGPVSTYQAAGGGQAPVVTADQVSAGSGFDGAVAARYMNPYQSAVQANTLRIMQEQAANDRASLNDGVQAAGAFGGTRQALLEAEQMKNAATARTDYVDSSNAAAFESGRSQFNTEEANRIATATGNADRRLQADTTTGSFLQAMQGRQDAASQFNAAAQNTADTANADRRQQVSLADQDVRRAYGLADQSAANTALGANADRSQATMIANMAAANAAASENAERSQAAGQFNAAARNTAAGANADRRQQSSLANQNSANTMATANADRDLQAQTTNAGLYGDMLQRMMAGGAQFGDIAAASSNLSGQDIARLASTGAVDQATEQAGLEAKYQEYLRSQQAPLEQYKDLMSILSGTPRDVTTSGSTSGSSTQKTSGSMLDTMMGLGQLGLSAYSTFSDPRLKKDVGLIERLANGLGIYRYRYLWERPTDDLHIGVMADEVAAIMPDALGPVVAGFLTVNYSKLQGAF